MAETIRPSPRLRPPVKWPQGARFVIPALDRAQLVSIPVGTESGSHFSGRVRPKDVPRLSRMGWEWKGNDATDLTVDAVPPGATAFLLPANPSQTNLGIVFENSING